MDASHSYLHVDGVPVAEDTNVVTVVPSDAGLLIGSGNDLAPASFCLGLIDDVRICDATLSTDEVAALAC